MKFRCDYEAATFRHELAAGHVIDVYKATITHKPTGKKWPGVMIVCPAGFANFTAVLDDLGFHPGPPGSVLTADWQIAGALVDQFGPGKQAIKIVPLPDPRDLKLFR